MTDAGILGVLIWSAGRGEGCSGVLPVGLLAWGISLLLELLATGDGDSLPLSESGSMRRLVEMADWSTGWGAGAVGVTFKHPGRGCFG